jgi:hypothetical protein
LSPRKKTLLPRHHELLELLVRQDLSATSTTLSDSPSKAAKADEIREEVENLVRRVVPEEIDNVDEMMLQFEGREEELVETLRTMQEKASGPKGPRARAEAGETRCSASCS